MLLFPQVEKDEIIKEINNPKREKITQSTDLSTKFIKENFDIFAGFVFENRKNHIFRSVFPVSLKKSILTSVHKKVLLLKH